MSDSSLHSAGERSSESGISNGSKHESMDNLDELQHIYTEIKNPPNPPNSRSSLTTVDSKEIPNPLVSFVSEKPSRFNAHTNSFRYEREKVRRVNYIQIIFEIN